MKLLLVFCAATLLLHGQGDSFADTAREWERTHQGLDSRTHGKALLDASAEWVAKWPNNVSAWMMRRDGLLVTRDRSAELWQQVGENLIRLEPHAHTAMVAWDWVVTHANLKDAEALIHSEIDWLHSKPRPALPAQPSLDDLIDNGRSGTEEFGLNCTLASAQIQLKEFESAHATIGKIRAWLDGDFKQHYDQDPLEAFPDYQSKYFFYSAQLAQAEGGDLDALAYWHQIMTNPYYRREYTTPADPSKALWKQLGGNEDSRVMFSKVPPLPAGVPAHSGYVFFPWLAINYRLPEMNLPGLNARTWTNRDFEGKSTLVYLWATSCAPCWNHLLVIQRLYEAIKDRSDIQVITLNADENPETLASFMRQKKYTFPVVPGKSYAEKMLPRMVFGQTWIVDSHGVIRLQRSGPDLSGREEAAVDEAVYKLLQVGKY